MAHAINDISDADMRMILAPGIGPATRRKLIETFQTVEQAVDASITALASIDGIGRTTAESLRRALDEADPDAERKAMAEAGARLILSGDADYPPLLAATGDAPAALWVRGELVPEDRLSIAIVGSRRCTAYGREQASRFAGLLAQAGLTIVSGGAAGVDGEAHRGALRVKGRTIVVVGCGLSRCYPPQHAELFERICAEGGALVSQFPMRTEPRGNNFPHRNRVISGLSLGVLVIEAAVRSGALITARHAAADHNREVMALPGRVDSPASAGCLQILRDGSAALVRDHVDVLNQLDSSSQLVRGAVEAAGQDGAAASATLFDGNLTEDQRAIVQVLSDAGDTLLVDQVAARTQLPMSRLMADLTLLQIRGRVARDHRGVRLRNVQS